jgi:hypothetical protein
MIMAELDNNLTNLISLKLNLLCCSKEEFFFGISNNIDFRHMICQVAQHEIPCSGSIGMNVQRVIW